MIHLKKSDPNEMCSPQTPCGVVEDIRVDVVVGAAVWPAGEWHHHVLRQSGQRRRCELLLQLVAGGQIPQQTYVSQEEFKFEKLKQNQVHISESFHPHMIVKGPLLIWFDELMMCWKQRFLHMIMNVRDDLTSLTYIIVITPWFIVEEINEWMYGNWETLYPPLTPLIFLFCKSIGYSV